MFDADEGELEVWYGFLLLPLKLCLMSFLVKMKLNCRPCELQRYLSQPEKLSCHASDMRELLNTLFYEKM